MKKLAVFFLLAVAVVGTTCNVVTPSTETLGAPLIQPIVVASMPAGLKPATTANIMRVFDRFLAALSPFGVAHAQTVLSVNGQVLAVFKNMFGKYSGGQAEGLINASLQDLDFRISDANSGIGATGGGKCLSAAAQAHRVNLSSVAAALDLTLNVQCSSAFSGGPNGMVFGRGVTAGQDGGATNVAPDSYSMWLYLKQLSNSDNFGYFANVTNVNTSDKMVDFVFLENSPSLNRISAYRVKAKPATTAFEFAYAGSTGYTQGGLYCGFRMISDGTNIWAEGKDLPPGSAGSACADAGSFTKCYAASSVAEQTDTTPCNALKTAFTMTAPTQAAVADAGAAINAVLPISTASGVTTAF